VNTKKQGRPRLIPESTIARVKELAALRWTYASIAREVGGISAPYVSQVLRGIRRADP